MDSKTWMLQRKAITLKEGFRRIRILETCLAAVSMFFYHLKPSSHITASWKGTKSFVST